VTSRVGPTLSAFLLVTLIVQIEITVVGTALPHITAELRDVSLYPWVFAGYLVAYTATVPVFGMLADSLGRRPAYVIGLFALSAGSLICGLADSMEILIAGRLLQGCGAGGLFITGQTLLGDLFSTEQRTRIQSAIGLVSAIGAAIGPALGGFFVTHVTWRWAFLITIPIAAIALCLFLYGYAPGPKRASAPPNWRGALLLATVLALLLAGLGHGEIEPLLLAVAAAVAVPFFMLERRAKRPILPPDLFANRAFRASALALFFVGGIQVAYLVLLPLYLQGVVGLSPSTSGYLQAVPVTITITGATFFVGKWIKKYGYRPVVRAGAACGLLATIATSTAAWGVVGNDASLVLLVAGQMFIGGLLALATTAAIICVQNQVPAERRGTATASVMLIRLLGTALTPVILGTLLLAALASQHLGLAPEQFLNQNLVSKLDPEALAAARFGLGVAMRSLLPIVIAIGALAAAASLLFPANVADVPAKPPA
jgi:MFS family permease